MEDKQDFVAASSTWLFVYWALQIQRQAGFFKHCRHTGLRSIIAKLSARMQGVCRALKQMWVLVQAFMFLHLKLLWEQFTFKSKITSTEEETTARNQTL